LVTEEVHLISTRRTSLLWRSSPEEGVLKGKTLRKVKKIAPPWPRERVTLLLEKKKCIVDIAKIIEKRGRNILFSAIPSVHGIKLVGSAAEAGGKRISKKYFDLQKFMPQKDERGKEKHISGALRKGRDLLAAQRKKTQQPGAVFWEPVKVNKRK